jgi:PAS domain-containing protein
MRVRPLGQTKRESKYAVWSIADITRDRERQEDVFQELQHASEYLDHAPCGFFSVNPGGEVVYVNATLANWLDHDLAEIGSGGLKLTDIVSGDGAALLTSITPMPGEVKTEVFDIDLRMRGGKTMTACRAPRGHWRSAAPATNTPIRSARPKSALCASSTIRRWRSPPSTAVVAWFAPTPATPSWLRA